MYLGASAASLLFDQLVDLLKSPSDAPSDITSPSITLPRQTTGITPAVFIPPLDIGKLCLEAYLRYVIWLHKPASSNEIEALFRSLYPPNGSRETRVSDLELALLLGTMALGAQAVPNESTCTSDPSLPAKLFDSSCALLNRSDIWRKPSLLACKTLHLHAVSKRLETR